MNINNFFLILFFLVPVSAFGASDTFIEVNNIVRFRAFNLDDSLVKLDIDKGRFETIELNWKINEVTYGPGSSVSTPISNCSNNKWNCINAGQLSFSIKKKWCSSEMTWAHNGYLFEILDFNYFNPSEVIDKTKSNYFIRARSIAEDPDGDFATIFIYSLNEGIKGFILYSPNFNEDAVFTRTFFKE